MRKINRIVVHCSDSDIDGHDNIETIRKWHTERGFTGADGIPGTEDDIAYHWFITKDGGLHKGRAEEAIGAHVRGHNGDSLGVCLSGRKKFTEAQFEALELKCLELCSKYDLEKKDILGHTDLDPLKTCPNFDVLELISGWNWH